MHCHSRSNNILFTFSGWFCNERLFNKTLLAVKSKQLNNIHVQTERRNGDLYLAELQHFLHKKVNLDGCKRFVLVPLSNRRFYKTVFKYTNKMSVIIVLQLHRLIWWPKNVSRKYQKQKQYKFQNSASTSKFNF